MNLEISKLPNNVGRIKLEGDLDNTGTGEIEARFFACCAGNAPYLIVDLSSVGFIGSLGIRMLLQGIKNVSARGGRLVLLNPTRMVDSALDISGLGQHVARGGEAEIVAAEVMRL